MSTSLSTLFSSAPKAVIFDFDGVILESADLKTAAFLQLFSAFPEHRDRIREYHLENQGISRFRKFEWIYTELLGRSLSDQQSQALGVAFSEIALESVLESPFVPGAYELLEGLHEKTLLFIASGTPEIELLEIVTKRQILHFFAGVWGTPRTKVEIIRSVLSSYELMTHEVLFIGDGISDYRAAKDTGIAFLARQTKEVDVDWKKLGVMAVSDLRNVSSLLCHQT